MSKKMLTKIGTALAIVAVVVPPVLLGGIWMDLLAGAVILLGSYEIAGLKDESSPQWPMTILIVVVVFMMRYCGTMWFPVTAGAWIVLLFIISLFDETITSDQVVYTFTMSLIFVFALQAIDRIYASGFKGAGMLYVGLACYGCDTGAYFFGSFFGKHKLIPRVSPNKTWEGAVGGYFCGMIVSMLFGIFLSDTMPNDLVIAGSIILPFIAEIGDLAFSQIKRRWNMKDFGSLFPGHGGVLDRVDSLLFCLMIFNALMIWKGIGV